MKLSELLKYVKPTAVVGSLDVDITGVNIDSRKIEKNHLFVAIKGTQTDGHRFIPKAIELGAVAVLCEDLPEGVSGETVDHTTYVQVESTEAAVGPVATVFYGEPSTKLRLVGVTGTNGKTTIATLLYNMFRKFGHRCGLLSTVCNYIEDEVIPADHTTPDPIELNKLLARMVDFPVSDDDARAGDGGESHGDRRGAEVHLGVRRGRRAAGGHDARQRRVLRHGGG